MGVDIHGCAFKAEREAEYELAEKIGYKELFKLPDAERPFRRDLPGRYFRSNWWYWRPVVRFLFDHIDEGLLNRCKYWNSNDGDGLNGHYAERLGKEILEMVKDGTAADWVIQWEARRRTEPHRPCEYCSETGVRRDPVAVDAGMPSRIIPASAMDETDDEGKREHPRAGETGWCNACDGRGYRESDNFNYPADLDFIREFGEFCVASGGFEIW